MICNILFVGECGSLHTHIIHNTHTNTGYLICNILFVGECGIRFVASGSFARYWSSSFHRAETLLVISGLVGLVTDIRVFLLAPALRLYRLMRYLPTLESLLLSAFSSMQAIFNLSAFIVTMALCFCVMGR